MSNVEDRVGKLEKTFARIVGGVTVSLLFLLGFFGYAHWYQIPGEVSKILPKAVEQYVENEHPQLESTLTTIEANAQEATETLKQAKNELQELISRSQSFDRFDERIANSERRIQSSIASFERKISFIKSVMISNIEFWDGCNLARIGNLCEISAPPCPSGYSSVHEWWDTWNGGRCGNGNKCRLCVRYSK